MSQTDHNHFILCLDTDHCAGNFERDLTAYCTGAIGECGVGEDQRDYFFEEVPEKFHKAFEDKIISLPDEHGCHRPCITVPTPGWVNIGEGFQHRFPAATLQAWYPAAHSVGILFSPEPDDDEISLITARAMKFLTERGVALEGLRLLKVEVITTQVKTIPLEGL